MVRLIPPVCDPFLGHLSNFPGHVICFHKSQDNTHLHGEIFSHCALAFPGWTYLGFSFCKLSYGTKAEGANVRILELVFHE